MARIIKYWKYIFRINRLYRIQFERYVNCINGTTPNYRIAILPNTTVGITVKFDSKESTTTSHKPRLEIILHGPKGPQGDKGDTGPQGLKDFPE